MPKKTPALRNKLPSSPSLPDFFDNLSVSSVLVDSQGRIVLANRAAKLILGSKNSKRWQELLDLTRMTLKYGHDSIKDAPSQDRIIRYQTQYLKINGKPYITATISDATNEWYEERQKDILEYVANAFAQNLPTTDWLQAILKRVVIMMEVQSSTIMLYNEQSKQLEAAVSTTPLSAQGVKLKLGEGVAGISAQKKSALAVYNTTTNKNYKPLNDHESPASLLALPMVVGEKLVGVLSIRDKAGKYFREQDKVFYSILANRLAVTLEYRTLLEQLRLEYNRLDTVINNAGESMVLLDMSGKIIMTNPPFANLLGATQKEIVGKELSVFLPEMKPVITTPTNEIYQEIELSSIEENPWVGVFASHIQNGSGGNIVLTINDITADKQLEQIKNDFIATATHELRTPLTAILGYLSMLGHIDGNLDPKQKLYLQRISQASGTLSQLVEDLLSVLKIDQNALQHKPEKHNLLPLVREITRTLESKMFAKKIKVTLPKNDYKVFADVSALQKVVINLVDNALKYSPLGSKVAIRFEKIVQNGRDFIKVYVQDSGIGIPKAKQKRLFEKFYRVQNELSVEAGGTGLGLYITKKLVSDWGGEIRLAHSGPEGSTFTFTVPQAK